MYCNWWSIIEMWEYEVVKETLDTDNQDKPTCMRQYDQM